MAALLLYALIIGVVFIIACIPQNVNAQSTSSGDVLPGRGVIIVNHQAVIDSNVVMMAQRASDSITNIKASIALKTTLAAAIAGLSMTTTGASGAATYNNTSGIFNIPQYGGAITSVDTLSSARAFNTAFLMSATKYVDVRISVQISCALSLSGGQAGTIFLETSPDASSWTTVAQLNNSNTGTLTIGLATTGISGGQLTTLLPPTYFWRARTSNVTGTPTFTNFQGVKITY